MVREELGKRLCAEAFSPRDWRMGSSTKAWRIGARARASPHVEGFGEGVEFGQPPNLTMSFVNHTISTIAPTSTRIPVAQPIQVSQKFVRGFMRALQPIGRQSFGDSLRW